VRALDDSPSSGAARKTVEVLMRRHRHDWDKVRHDLRIEFDLLFAHGSTGSKLFAMALDDMFFEIRPTDP